MSDNDHTDAPRFAALRFRDFRLLWVGQAFSSTGSQMQIIAVTWHVYALVRGDSVTLDLFGLSIPFGAEALALGTLGLVRVLPIFLFSLLGGIAADRIDRRRLIMVTAVIQGAIALVLTALTLNGWVTLGWLYLLTALDSAAGSFDEPARQSLIPRLVPDRHLSNAVGLNVMLFYLGTIFGPVVAGFLIDAADVGFVYGINAVSFSAVVLSLLLMAYRGQAADTKAQPVSLAIREGLRVTLRSPLLLSTSLLDFQATFFGSVRALLPLVADQIFGLGAAGYGLLATAQPIGAVLAAVTMTSRRDVKWQGPVLLGSVVVYGLATTAFGVAITLPSPLEIAGYGIIFWLAYGLFAFTGAGDMVSTIIRGTIRQIAVPDRLRGRTSSITLLFAATGPQLGEMEAGAVAAALGVPFAIISGGVAAVVVTLLIAWGYPALRAYTGSPAQIAEAHALAERYTNP